MAKRRKYTHTSFNVDVDIPLYEILESLSDEDLIEEIKERELSFKKANVNSVEARDEVLRDIWERLRDGEAGAALLIAERFLFPKYPSVAACEERLKELRGASNTAGQ